MGNNTIALETGKRYLFRRNGALGCLWSGTVTEVANNAIRIRNEKGDEYWHERAAFEERPWPREADNVIIEELPAKA